jgi:hypothetical protein
MRSRVERLEEFAADVVLLTALKLNRRRHGHRCGMAPAAGMAANSNTLKLMCTLWGFCRERAS